MRPIRNRYAALIAGLVALSAMVSAHQAGVAGQSGEVHFPVSCRPVSRRRSMLRQQTPTKSARR